MRKKPMGKKITTHCCWKPKSQTIFGPFSALIILLGDSEASWLKFTNVSPRSPATKWLHGTITLALCTLYLILFVFRAIDVADALTPGSHDSLAMKLQSKLLVLLQFSNINLTYLTALVLCLYLRMRSFQLFECLYRLQALIGEYELCSQAAEQKKASRRLIIMLFLATAIQFSTKYFLPWKDLLKMLYLQGATFAYLQVPTTFNLIFIRLSSSVTIFLVYFISAFFCYLSSLLVCCCNRFSQELEPDDNRFAYINPEKRMFLCRFKMVVGKHRRLVSTFLRLQRFVGKVSCLTIIYHLLCIFSSVAGVAYYQPREFYSFVAFCIGTATSILLHVIGLWMLARSYLPLHYVNQRIRKDLERQIAFYSSLSNTSALEEYYLKTRICSRLKTHPMIFSAGGFLRITPRIAIPVFSALLGFVSFVINRMEDNSKRLMEHLGIE